MHSLVKKHSTLERVRAIWKRAEKFNKQLSALKAREVAKSAVIQIDWKEVA